LKEAADLLTTETTWKMIEEIKTSLSINEELVFVEDITKQAEVSQFVGTVVERVRQFFLSTDNKPASNATIRDAIGTNRGTLAMVLYTTHKDEFEKIQIANTHIVHWRMVWDAYQFARGDNSNFSGGGEPAGDGDPIPF
jgi:hypothetical protein